jgi:hypothetical protein
MLKLGTVQSVCFRNNNGLRFIQFVRIAAWFHPMTPLNPLEHGSHRKQNGETTRKAVINHYQFALRNSSILIQSDNDIVCGGMNESRIE